MTKKDKLEARIRNNHRNVSLDDFEALIRLHGHIKEGRKHPRAVIGDRVFPYRRTNPVLTPYVAKVIELIDDLSGQRQTETE